MRGDGARYPELYLQVKDAKPSPDDEDFNLGYILRARLKGRPSI